MTDDRIRIAYELIASTLRRHGLPVNVEELTYSLHKLPLPATVRLRILMEHESHIRTASEGVKAWRAHSLLSNPFA